MVSAHLESCAPLGELAKYFLRAIARQDMIFGLTYRRRNLIPTSLWFDGDCFGTVDRFLGLTMSLMPLLEELCCLAEDIKKKNQQQLQDIQPQKELCDSSLLFDDDFYQSGSSVASLSSVYGEIADNDERVKDLQQRINMWRPSSNNGLSSFLEKRKYLLQAQAFRSAALLYLHRLCHPTGMSAEADSMALNMAYDILLSCHEDDADVRMILWPLFVSGCEVKSESDRQLVLGLLDRNHRARGTYTPLKATKFLVECLWPAVDSGSVRCDWMDLVEEFSGDFAPL